MISFKFKLQRVIQGLKKTMCFTQNKSFTRHTTDCDNVTTVISTNVMRSADDCHLFSGHKPRDATNLNVQCRRNVMAISVFLNREKRKGNQHFFRIPKSINKNRMS